MKKQKRQRILTKRYTSEEGNDTAFEFIEMEEIDGRQYLHHRLGETRLEFQEDGSYRIITAEGCFPVSVDLVQERFIELGREYIPTGKEVARLVKDLLIK